MRIAHLLGDLKLPADPERGGASGAVRAALEIARAQVRRGHHVTVAAVGREAWRAEWQGVWLRSLRHAPWARLRLGGRELDLRVHQPYVALAAAGRFEVIQGHLYSYLRFLHAPLRIAHIHSDPFYRGEGGPDISLRPADFARIRASSGAQVAVSHFVGRQLERAFGDGAGVYVVHNGVDAARFDPASHVARRAALRAGWGAGAADTVFLYAGAVVPPKGVLHLARAFARLSAERPDVHLAIAGSSALWDQSIYAADPHASYGAAVRGALAPALGRGRVHLLGGVDGAAMPGVYAAADAAVIPSIWQEPFPLVALEALAAGLPLVASEVGGLPESVDAASGLLVPPADEPALHAALARLAADPDLRRRLGQGARARALGFTWDRAAQALDAIYRRHRRRGEEAPCAAS